MAFLEGLVHHSEASLVGAPDVSLERPFTFFRVKFPLGMDCTEIHCKSGKLLLVARWNGEDGLDWVYVETKTEKETETEGKVKRLDEDPSHGSLSLVGAISDDGKIFLHEGLVADGNRQQAEAYCRRLIESLSDD